MSLSPSRSSSSSLLEPTELLNCPICLADSVDRAIVLLCCHQFCQSCIAAWTAIKRVCPLCKGRITSYRYDIRSDTDFQEVVFSPSPQRRSLSPRAQPRAPHDTTRDSRQQHANHRDTERGAAVGYGEDPAVRYARAVLEIFGQHEAAAGGADRSQLRVERGRVSAADEDSRQRRQPSSNSGGGGDREGASGGGQQRHNRGRSSSGGGRDGDADTVQQHPRPYYYRVQHRMLGIAHGTSSSGAATGATPQQSAGAPQQPPLLDPAAAAVARRRAVYDAGAWADPASLAPRPGAPPPPPHTAGNPRLVEWVERELSALLPGGAGGSIVAAFVLGQVRAFGLDRDYAAEAVAAASGSSSRGQRALTAAGAVGTAPGLREVRWATAIASVAAAGRGGGGVAGPVHALEPFLCEHTALFWHELRTFARSGLSLSAYDGRVRYLRGPNIEAAAATTVDEPRARGSGGPAATAGGSGALGASRETSGRAPRRHMAADGGRSRWDDDGRVPPRAPYHEGSRSSQRSTVANQRPSRAEAARSGPLPATSQQQQRQEQHGRGQQQAQEEARRTDSQQQPQRSHQPAGGTQAVTATPHLATASNGTAGGIKEEGSAALRTLLHAVATKGATKRPVGASAGNDDGTSNGGGAGEEATDREVAAGRPSRSYSGQQRSPPRARGTVERQQQQQQQQQQQRRRGRSRSPSQRGHRADVDGGSVWQTKRSRRSEPLPQRAPQHADSIENDRWDPQAWDRGVDISQQWGSSARVDYGSNTTRRQAPPRRGGQNAWLRPDHSNIEDDRWQLE